MSVSSEPPDADAAVSADGKERSKSDFPPSNDGGGERLPSGGPSRRRLVALVALVAIVAIASARWVFWNAGLLRRSLERGGGLLLYDGELGFANVEDLSDKASPDWLRKWIQIDFQEPEFELYWQGGAIPLASLVFRASKHDNPKAVSFGGLTPPLGKPYLGFMHSWKDLEYLQLSGLNIFEDTLSDLHDLGQLKYLGLRHCDSTFHDQPDAAMPSVAGFQELRYLSVAESKLSDLGLKALRPLGKLSHLSLAGTQVSDAGLESLRAFPQLRYLSLARTQVSDAGLAHLGVLANLEELNLSETRIEGAGLAHLAALKKLRTLFLTRTRVSDSAVVHIAKLRNLDTLGLSATRVSDDGLKQIAVLSRLKELHLAHTDVSDAGLPAITQMQHLEILSLAFTRITDAGVPQLEKLTCLRVLGVTQDGNDDRVTLAGLSRLGSLRQLRHLGVTGFDYLRYKNAHTTILPRVELADEIREHVRPEAYVVCRLSASY